MKHCTEIQIEKSTKVQSKKPKRVQLQGQPQVDLPIQDKQIVPYNPNTVGKYRVEIPPDLAHLPMKVAYRLARKRKKEEKGTVNH